MVFAGRVLYLDAAARSRGALNCDDYTQTVNAPRSGSYVAVLTSGMSLLVAAPTSIVAGTVAGTLGYFGGRSAAQMVCEIVWPDLIHQQERGQIETIRTAIAEAIQDFQRWSAK